jgi:hypothetical protein
LQLTLSPADCGKADHVFIMIVIVVCSFHPNVRHQRPAQPVRCMPWLGCSSVRSGILDDPFELINGRPQVRKAAGWYPAASERRSSSPAIGVHLTTLARAPKRGAFRLLVVLTASSPGHTRAL